MKAHRVGCLFTILIHTYMVNSKSYFPYNLCWFFFFHIYVPTFVFLRGRASIVNITTTKNCIKFKEKA